MDDDQHLEYKNEFSLVGPRKKCAPWTNEAFRQLPHYDYYMFVGDDHRFRTKDWDKKILEGGAGITYGRDGFQDEKLPTWCVIDGRIPRTLGYLVLPDLIHLFMDNFWKDLGETAKCLSYRDDILIEHMHPAAHKAEIDDQYNEVNDQKVYNHDQAVYQKWVREQRASDVQKVRDALSK